ncbi:MAG: o-succinylbenzoate synthase [Anditalea sp.]
MSDSFEIKVDAIKYPLDFKFDAGTSRGVLKRKDSYLIRVRSHAFPGLCGYGEAGPLPHLSVDDIPSLEEVLKQFCKEITKVSIPSKEGEILDLLKGFIPDEFPSIRFAMEVAILDLINGGQRRILKNSFYDQHTPMSINGLIWMGDREFMLQQIEKKLDEGYNCIKMKIGSIDFEQECELLAFIRHRFSADQIILRVDANGAFSEEEALSKLQRLSEFELHSIEQPIRSGQWQTMGTLCQESPIPIALDEELIGVHSLEDKADLLNKIRPQYLILKPTLVGGILSTREWISLAGQRGIGWWMTSALESNIGLNAIAQLTASYDPQLPQGLGTGQLYHNNIDSPLKVHKGKIYYDKDINWGNVEGLFGEDSQGIGGKT